MKFTKTLTLILAVAMLFSTAVLANEVAETDEIVVLNGAVVENISVIEENGVSMLPLRHVAENLGYTVTWNEEGQSIELIKGAQFITMAIGQDSYAFSRRAPQALGSAPFLYNDCTTYVPVSFVTEIIGGYYNTNEDGTLKVVIPTSVTAVEVLETGLIVKDNITEEEVIVFVDENTEFVGVSALADIKAEMVLGIEYGPAMTMSLPPQTTAVKIIAENLPEELPEETTTVTFSGVITEIDGEKVIVGDPTKDADAIALIVTDETVITKGLDKRIYKIDDLTVGTKISGTIGEAATMSIPPQSVALTINIEG